MELVPPNDFLPWARTREISSQEEDPYPLTYHPHPYQERFWNVPPRGARMAFFISHLLKGLDPWSECFLWPRGGWWPEVPTNDHIIERVEVRVLAGAGIVANTRGAMRYSAKELDQLVTAVFAKLSFGWCLSDDLFIVPDHGRQFMQASHHDVVHVMVRDEERMRQFIQHMELGEFPLPTRLPDATFKKPDWMD